MLEIILFRLKPFKLYVTPPLYEEDIIVYLDG